MKPSGKEKTREETAKKCGIQDTFHIRKPVDMMWLWMFLPLALALIAMWLISAGSGWIILGMSLGAGVVAVQLITSYLLMAYYENRGSARSMGLLWFATIIILIILIMLVVPFSFHASRVLKGVQGNGAPPFRTKLVQQYETKQNYILEVRKLMHEHRVRYFAQVYHRTLFGLAVVDKESGLYDMEAEAAAHGKTMRDDLIAQRAEWRRQKQKFQEAQYREFDPEKDAFNHRLIHQVHYLDRETVVVLQNGDCALYPYDVLIYRWRKNKWRYRWREWWGFKNIYEAQARFDLVVRGTTIEK